MKIHIAKISKKIKNLREEHNFTQEQLAKELGVSRQSVIAIEQGRCLPSLSLAFSLTEVFDLAFENIFCDLEQIHHQVYKREDVKKMPNDLTPWSPIRELTSLHDTIDRLFEDSMPVLPKTALTMPSVNVYEKNNSIIIEADVPGVKEEDLTVEVSDDQLIIRGERKSETEVEEKEYYRREKSYGSFSRVVALPAEVDQKGINAELKDGILMIQLPKKAEATPRVTKVKVTRK